MPKISNYFSKGMSADIICPYCHHAVHVDSLYFKGDKIISKEGFVIEELHYIWHDKLYMEREWWITFCPKCLNPMLILNNGENVVPSPQPKELCDPSIDKQVQNAFNEAKLCFSVGAYHACTIMCRRSLERLCIDKGATGYNLKEKIEQLTKKGNITPEIKEWAHANREIANDGVHDEEYKVIKQDAEDILLITEKLIEVVYIIPKIAKQQLKKRKENKN